MAAPNLTKEDSPGERQSELVQTNVRWLVQTLNLLEAIDDETYTRRPAAIPHTIGGHVRHLLDYYDCLLDGLDGARIDYDSRGRDERVAGSRLLAMTRIRSTMERLESSVGLKSDPTLFVRIEDAGELIQDPYLVSSAGRELMVLSSHTVHHLALIAVTLQCLGVDVDSKLGVGPATLRYRARLEAAEGS